MLEENEGGKSQFLHNLRQAKPHHLDLKQTNFFLFFTFFIFFKEKLVLGMVNSFFLSFGKTKWVSNGPNTQLLALT